MAYNPGGACPEMAASLNTLAGTTGRSMAAAANIWAGISPPYRELVAALNVKAGNALGSYREFDGVCNQLAGTTGLMAQLALATLANAGGEAGGIAWSAATVAWSTEDETWAAV